MADSSKGRRSGPGRPPRQPGGRRPAAWIGLAVVLLLLTGVVVAAVWRTGAGRPGSASSGPSAASGQSGGPPVPAAVLQKLTAIPSAAFDAAGTGGLPAPQAVPAGTQVPAAPGAGTKPTLLYVGAEFCPYCATERWALVVALARFGTWQGLELSRSSSQDVYPDTPTFTFLHASYSSPYLAVRTVELTGREPGADGRYPPLQSPTAAEQALMNRLDPGGSIPFLAVGRSYWVGSPVAPELFQGKSWEAIAREIAQGKSAAAQQVLAAANQISAAVCQATGGRPAEVCASPAVRGVKLR
ncbi:MAG: DUF929 domain-containing protein [Firmicutes bacterium]|nr:DUF929 domain-containing protein [Bacillota bacterium]